MSLRPALWFFLLLCACAALGRLDGRPRMAELATRFDLTVNFVDGADVNAKARELGHELEHGRVGFTVAHGTRGGAFTCDIYVKRPMALSTSTQTLIGHELLHCIFGNYHDE